MLDEPSLRLAPLIVKEIFHIISALRGTGVATLLIEQNARLRCRSRTTATCWRRASLRWKGRRRNSRRIHVIETYLGLAKKTA